MMMEHYGLGGTLGWLGLALAIVMHIGLAALIVMGAISLYRSTFNNNKSSHASAVEILQQRYARGEITNDEYHRMKLELS